MPQAYTSDAMFSVLRHIEAGFSILIDAWQYPTMDMVRLHISSIGVVVIMMTTASKCMLKAIKVSKHEVQSNCSTCF